MMDGDVFGDCAKPVLDQGEGAVIMLVVWRQFYDVNLVFAYALITMNNVIKEVLFKLYGALML